jgi:hypothetical protein
MVFVTPIENKTYFGRIGRDIRFLLIILYQENPHRRCGKNHYDQYEYILQAESLPAISASPIRHSLPYAQYSRF